VEAVRTPPVAHIAERGSVAVGFEHVGADTVEVVVELKAERSIVWRVKTNAGNPPMMGLCVGVRSHDQRNPSRPPDVDHTGGGVTVPDIDIYGDLG
jgi:hypothetical protein